MTIEQAQEAAEKGQTVHWKTHSYTLKTWGNGSWWVCCVNGHVAPLNGHKAEDFFIPETSTPKKP